MVMTTLISWHAMRKIAGWSTPVALAITVVFVVIDVLFFLANATKIPQGGFVPLLMAVAVLVLILTWRKGRELLRIAIERRSQPLDELIEDIDSYQVVPGTAIYMSGYEGTAPPALVSNVRYNRCRHEVIILLTISVGTEARVPREQRYVVKALPKNFYQVVLHYGFMDQLDLATDVLYLPEFDIPIDITDATFVLGHETLSVHNRGGMAWWRKHIFVFFHRNSRTPVSYFGVPFKRVLEIGGSVEI
jgi:KUP system potassium uptake protein